MDNSRQLGGALLIRVAMPPEVETPACAGVALDQLTEVFSIIRDSNFH